MLVKVPSSTMSNNSVALLLLFGKKKEIKKRKSSFLICSRDRTALETSKGSFSFQICQWKSEEAVPTTPVFGSRHLFYKLKCSNPLSYSSLLTNQLCLELRSFQRIWPTQLQLIPPEAKERRQHGPHYCLSHLFRPSKNLNKRFNNNLIITVLRLFLFPVTIFEGSLRFPLKGGINAPLMLKCSASFEAELKCQESSCTWECQW